VIDPEGVLSFALVDSPSLTGKALQVTITGTPSAFPYTAGIFWPVSVPKGATLYYAASVYPDASGFEWRRVASDPSSPLLPTETWTELLVGPATDNGDGVVQAAVTATILSGGYSTPAVFLADRIRFVTPACIDGTPDDGTTPDDEPPNTSGLLFVDSFEEDVGLWHEVIE
jgi:hypothetical protein